jgi:DNA replication and repair protein RecF
MVALGRELVRARVDATVLLAARFSEIAAELLLDSATLAYEGDEPTLEELASRLESDLERGTTGAGAHLHDLRIEAVGRDLRMYGSQGEQRIAVLSLVLAEADVLRTRTGSSPLLLLDDVLSELDEGRRRALVGLLVNISQTVVTATSAAALPGQPTQSLAVTPGEVR